MNNNHDMPQYIKLSFVERLVQGIIHDMGASVRHITQFQKILNNASTKPIDKEKEDRWHLIIEESGERLQEMIASLALFSSLSVNTYQSSEVNLNEVFTRVKNYYLDKYNDTKISLTFNEDWPSVIGYEVHWTKLFSCLLENAILFQPKDDNHTIQIEVNCRLENNQILFSIDDNGKGATEYQRKEISKPFKRLNPVGEFPGIGMGLTYCEYIAELNNATLQFEQSKLGGLQVIYKCSYPSAST